MHILYHSYDDMTRKKISIIQLRIQSYEKKEKKDVLQQLINSGRESLVRMDNPNISYKTYLKEMKILDAHLLLHHDELLRLQNEKKKN